MAILIVLDDYWNDGKRIHVAGHVVASGNYAANGDVADLSPLSVGSGAQAAPIQGTFDLQMPGGYFGTYVDPVAAGSGDPGSISGGKIAVKQCANAAAPAADIGAGAYPAALTAAVWPFYAIFRRGNVRG